MRYTIKVVLCAFIFLCTFFVQSAVVSQEKITQQHTQELFCQLVYIDQRTREQIMTLAELVPDFSWSEMHKKICADICDQATVMMHQDVAQTIAECISAAATNPEYEHIQQQLEKYQRLLYEGKAHVCNWELDQDNQLHTRNFDGDRIILQLGVRSLTVEGTEIVNGLLLVNGILKINGRLILNGIDIANLIANRSGSASGIVTIQGNTGSVTGSTVTIEGGDSIFTTTSSTTSLVVSVTGTTQFAVQIGDGMGGLASITNLGTALQALTSTGTAIAPSFQDQTGGNVTITGDDGTQISGSNLTFTAQGQGGGTVTFIGDNVQTMSLNFTDINQSTCIGQNTPTTSTPANVQNAIMGQGAVPTPTNAARNAVIGDTACTALINGNDNAIAGYGAAVQCTGPFGNVAIGTQSLGASGSGCDNNTLVGYLAGRSYGGGDANNTCFGANVFGVALESDIMRFGDTTTNPINATFIAGIRNATITTNPVRITSAHRLGITTSSKRFKEHITPMPHSLSEKIFKLQPVTFNYKVDTTKTPTWGLIAEDVQEIFPHLVIYEENGQPLSVKYDELPVLMLNETKKLVAEHEELLQQLAELCQEVEDLSK